MSWISEALAFVSLISRLFGQISLDAFLGYVLWLAFLSKDANGKDEGSKIKRGKGRHYMVSVVNAKVIVDL